MRLVVSALLVAALAAGCDGGGKKYSRTDVERAFRSEGIELVAPNRESPRGVDGLIPVSHTTGEQYVVVIYPDEQEAKNSFRTVKRQAGPEAFNVRTGNVIVTADEGVSALTRTRINAALFQLS